jgi:hypothetical protein
MDKMQHKILVDELISLIEKGNAHVSFKKAVANLPPGLRTVIPENLPYSIWQLVEHMRIAQKDIVDFSYSADSESLNWPDDYWTEPVDNVSDENWNNSLNAIEADQQRFQALLEDENNDIYAPLPWGTGQSILREALLIADHNAYHTAEIVLVRRLLKSWR